MLSALRLSSVLTVALVGSACSVNSARNEVKKADAAMAKGDHDTAIDHFDEAIRLDRRFARAHYGRGVAYARKGLHDTAIASYTEAIRLEPENDVCVFDRGLAYWEHGSHQQALADFKKAIELNPKNDSAYNGMAWAMSTSPHSDVRDGKAAVEMATRACELTEWRNPYHLSTLAAAYAEVGQFERAIEFHKKAMASPEFPAAKMDRARQRLELYEEGQPYREVTK